MVSLALIVAAVVLGEALISRAGVCSRVRLALGWIGVALLLVVAVALSPGSFELRKFVGLCLMPAGLAWLGLLALARALAARGHSGFAGAALGLWFVYTLAGNAWLGAEAAGWLQRPYVSVDPLKEAPFDAVLVLGGGVEVGDKGVPMLTAAGDRVVLAARLYRAGKAKVLATSGPFVALSGGRWTSDAAATATIWRQLGVPADGIVLLEGPRTTTDEVVALKRAVARNGWRRIGLLTSAWHLRRAMGLCARHGVEVTPLPADAFEPPGPELRWVVPQQLGFWRVQMAFWEILGALAGR